LTFLNISVIMYFMNHNKEQRFQPKSKQSAGKELYLFGTRFGAGALAAVALATFGPQLVKDAKEVSHSIHHPEVVATIVEPVEKDQSTTEVVDNAIDKLASQYQIPRYAINDIYEESRELGPDLSEKEALEVDLERDFIGTYSVEIDRVPKTSMEEIAIYTPGR
jgi:hypothetical protein